ncbi:MAG: carbon-nitrogen hydrolase family protein [Verrucomicrobiota bacterium]
MSFRLALIQMAVTGGDPATNLSCAEKLGAEACAAGADFLLLPEALDLGWTHPSALTAGEPVPGGEPCQRLADLAARHSVYLCAGLTEKDGDRVYNTAVVFDRSGTLLLKHRKLNELEIGHVCYDQGGSLVVCPTEFGMLGVMICADAFARDEVISRTLGYLGADFILSPCAWAVPADHDQQQEPYGALWKDVYGRVAREFSIWVAGCSNVGTMEAGPWEGRKCIGCSLVTDPRGASVLQGPYDQTALLYQEIEPVPRPTRGDGWAMLDESSRTGALARRFNKDND